MCIYMYICICMCIYGYMYIYAIQYIQTYYAWYMHLSESCKKCPHAPSGCVWTKTPPSDIYIRTCIYIYICIYVIHTYVYIYIHIITYVYVYMYAESLEIAEITHRFEQPWLHVCTCGLLRFLDFSDPISISMNNLHVHDSKSRQVIRQRAPRRF